MRLNRGLEAGALLVQGILTGLSLASVYTSSLAENLESFVAGYEVFKEPQTAVVGRFRSLQWASLCLFGCERYR